MTAARKRTTPRAAGANQDVRDQEVLRANKELAAYFKGERTEREARSALKIIKAFIREREHEAPAHRRPLPGMTPPKATKKAANRETAGGSTRRRRSARRPIRDDASTDATTSHATPVMQAPILTGD